MRLCSITISPLCFRMSDLCKNVRKTEELVVDEMIEYEGTLYRPPSEANSLIIQVTIGCAHNTCIFCNMYKQKTFRIRKEEEILAELLEVANSPYRDYIDRVFFADGDALCIPTEMMLRLLNTVNDWFPHVQRVTAYAAAMDVIRKSDQELLALRNAGLLMVYMGVESGDAEILKYIHKDCTPEDYILAAKKLHDAGIKNSVTLISGLGGRERVEQHAVACADIVSAMKPEYCSFLTLGLFAGTPMYEDAAAGRFERITDREILEEMILFLEHVDSEGTVFRSNHASNYLPLAGTLNADIPNMKRAIQRVMETGYHRPFREYGDL